MSSFVLPKSRSGRRAISWLVAGVALACLTFNRLPAGEERAGVGLPEDWSHRHLIYSQPATFADAARLGSEPRYRYQWLHRNRRRTPSADILRGLAPLRQSPLHVDWSRSIGESTASVGPDNYPALFTSGSQSITSANCSSDFVVFNTGLAGGSGQASLIAFNQLYAGTCTRPAINWAYNTGGTVVTSPVLSADGSQVAFVQSAGTTASLIILKWNSGEGVSAAHPAAVTPGNTFTCSSGGCSSFAASYVQCKSGSTSCLLSLAFTVSDTYSSPFYDYAGDNLYVGDDAGVLHKFTGVFKGTPAAATSNWPVTLASGLKLTSPVFDGAQVYVGSTDPTGSNTAGGVLYSVPASGSGHGASSKLGAAPGIVDSPVVDSSAGKVYVFVGNDGRGSSAVYQFSGGTIGGAGKEATVGSSAGGVPLYAGTFDNAYYSASSPTGRLYLCGNTASTPILYSVQINNNVMGTPVAGPVLTSGNAQCSPVNEGYNGFNDWVFLSVTANGVQTACTGACVYDFDVSSGPAAAATAGLRSGGGASGIIIDTIFGSNSTGISQIYFSPLAGSHDAVQASQAPSQ